MARRDGLPWNGATHFEDSWLIYRGVTSDANHIKNGVRYQVFLRYPKDIDGLSIANPVVCSEEELCALLSSLHTCFGIVTLGVGDIRAFRDPDLVENLDVKPDEHPDPDFYCDHGYITGVPMLLRQAEGHDAEVAKASKVLCEGIATKLKDLVLDTWVVPEIRRPA
jgi:hypothetical protein